MVAQPFSWRSIQHPRSAATPPVPGAAGAALAHATRRRTEPRIARRMLASMLRPNADGARIAGQGESQMADGEAGAPRAKFNAMAEGSAEDWAIISANSAEFGKGKVERILTHLRLLDG